MAGDMGFMGTKNLLSNFGHIQHLEFIFTHQNPKLMKFVKSFVFFFCSKCSNVQVFTNAVAKSVILPKGYRRWKSKAYY